MFNKLSFLVFHVSAILFYRNQNNTSKFHKYCTLIKQDLHCLKLLLENILSFSTTFFTRKNHNCEHEETFLVVVSCARKWWGVMLPGSLPVYHLMPEPLWQKDISASLVEFVINDFNIIEKYCIVMCQVTCVFEVTKANEKSQTQMYHLLPTFFKPRQNKINKFTKAWISNADIFSILVWVYTSLIVPTWKYTWEICVI